MNMRYAKEEEIDDIKEIWNYCFNDEESFVNYYFNNKYDNNNTIVACEDKDIVSSLQLNQYKIKLDGKEYETMAFDHGNPPVEIEKFVNKITSFGTKR